MKISAQPPTMPPTGTQREGMIESFTEGYQQTSALTPHKIILQICK
jgi:hypothetical protein